LGGNEKILNDFEFQKIVFIQSVEKYSRKYYKSGRRKRERRVSARAEVQCPGFQSEGKKYGLE